MKLTVFPSGAGDCLLVSSSDGHHILVDGGFQGTFKDHARGRLAAAAADNGLDLICVSHIDSDHISGILRLLDDVLDWRVFRLHEGDDEWLGEQPDFVEPPPIGAIWYNGFGQVFDDVTPIEDMLLFQARALAAGESHLEQARHTQFFANSVKQGLQLTHRISPQQLAIPLNPSFDGGMMFVTDPPDVEQVGSLQVQLVGPFLDELNDLRDEWNDWVTKNQNVIEDLQREAEADRRRLRLSDAESLRRMLSRFALSAERGPVTPENLASIVLLVQEDGKRMLLGGDARDEEILLGLEHLGELDAEGRMHVEILKIQHHGSINNVNRDFCKAVIADNYVICGGSGGTHKNPDIDVLQFIIDSRIGSSEHRSTHGKAGDHFHLWFSSNETSNAASANAHMTDVLEFAREAAAGSGDRFTVHVMPTDKDFLEVPA